MTKAKMKVHPVAALFPMMGADELAALAADITERGQLQPIVVGAGGEILDGRNRAVSCEMAGVAPDYVTYQGDDPAGYALAANVQRRNLTTSQRYMIMEQARRLNGQSMRKAAGGTNSYHSHLAEAATVLDHAPDLAADVASGLMPLYKAVEAARERKRQAQELAERLAAVQAEAPDQYQLIEAGQQSLDDAWAVLESRRSNAKQQADEQAVAHEAAVRRSANYLESALHGLVVVVSIPRHQDRDEIVALLAPHDQEIYLRVEEFFAPMEERIRPS